ncbi:MAG: AAA family ATPase [Myxococcales bacterium]
MGSNGWSSFSTALGVATGGVLLVDELDDGLHYTVLPRLWRFLVEAARKLDLQVFATTHSRDCIEAIASLQREADGTDLAQDITVHRLELGSPRTVRMDSRIVRIALEGSQELR